MLVIGANYWDQGGVKISGGTGVIEIRDDAGNRFDFADNTWKATTPTTPTHALTEDAVNDAGFYSIDLTITTWGTRRWQAQTTISQAGYSDQVDTHTGAVIAGAVASPVFVPTPGAGVAVVLMCLLPSGAPMATQPQATLCLDVPASDFAAIAREGTWNGTNGTITWTVPPNCTVLASCKTLGICGGYAVAAAQVTLNTATPIY